METIIEKQREYIALRTLPVIHLYFKLYDSDKHFNHNILNRGFLNEKHYSLDELGWKDCFKDQLDTDDSEMIPARVTMTHKGHLVVSTGHSELLLK